MITVDEARRYYLGDDHAHDFDHVLRVLRLAERIGQAEGADMEVLRAAVLLHDLAAAVDRANHHRIAAQKAREILRGHPPEQVEAVAHAILAHRFRAPPEPATLEAQVLFDADSLDALGAIGIARAYVYGALQRQRLWAPVPPGYQEGEGEHTPVHEFVIKLSRIKERLYTPTARAIAVERDAFMRAFFARLEAEVQGII